MEELERAKSFDFGVTLIEMMVGLVIFSCLIGLSSNLIHKGTEFPFVSVQVERWLKLVDETNTAVQLLPEDFNLQLFRIENAPLNQLTLPVDLISWRLKWLDNNREDLKTAEFSATTNQGKKIVWRVHKKKSL